MPGPVVVASGGLTLTGLIREVRFKLDALQVDAAGNDVVDTFWTDEEITTWINEGYDKYLQIRIDTGEGNYESIIEQYFTQNQAQYDLPGDLLRVQQIDAKINDGTWAPLRYVADSYQVIGVSDDAVPVGHRLPTYRFSANKVEFNPAPATSGDLWRLRYYAIAPPLADTRAVPLLPRVWHRLLVLHAVVAGAMKDQNTELVKLIAAEKASQEQIFLSLVENRSNFPQFAVSFEDVVGVT